MRTETSTSYFDLLVKKELLFESHSKSAKFQVASILCSILFEVLRNTNSGTQKEKSLETVEFQGFFTGAAGQIRTADLILTKDALCLLSYSSTCAPDA